MEKCIQGLNLNYIVEGEGRPILVLHGWGANIETVMSIVNILKKSYKVYALDLPGFGKSQEPKEAIDSFQYGEIVKEFIESENIDKISLIGHSFGGKLSIILASRYPELVDRVVLVNSAGLIPKRGLDYYFKVYSFKCLKFIYKNILSLGNEEKMEKFYKKFGSDDYQDSSGVMRKILVIVVNENLKEVLKDIKSETLIIWGDKDTATPIYMAHTMEKNIENSGLVVLEGSGHFSYLDDFGKFSAVIKSFFNI